MLGKLFDSNEKRLKTLHPLVEKINSFGPSVEKLSKEQIQEKTKNWKEKARALPEGDSQKFLEEILPEAYALVKEATKRVQGITLHDVQLMAGIVLHQGKVAEQKTGEGKTNTATMPLYLTSLLGRGAHLVTPNDYLSRHGAGWMGPIYDYLGVSVGAIMQEKAFCYDSSYENMQFQDEYARHLREVPRQGAYQCDITYGTNHEFGFDYLRDNMVYTLSDTVQTNPLGLWGIHNFAIVDEVDSILIDVARTPLIISAAHAQPSQRYHDSSRIVKELIKDTDYEVEEKYKSVTLTDFGIRKVERLLGVANLYEQDFEMVHLLEQALIAQTLYEKDRDYVVKEGKIVIVDQFTGRLLPSNRYSHGLHQAIEAKEKVEIQQESRTLAEISYQNYFRMYKKLSGMTGTAVTEAEEFYKIYGLDVVAIPTDKPVARIDSNDVVYKTEAGKFSAAAEEISQRHEKGQPVLVGTTSVEKSQLLHDYLNRKKIPHEILNAKNHEKEALIIAQAGRAKAVTVSTNMAGRGVDIILGGDPPDPEEQEKVKALGGLCVIGTERHESRRIDNQLRGRAGRQGDPGSSRFFVSLQDDLMRIFGGAQVESLMNKFGLDDNTPLEAGLVTKAIETAQKRVEGFNFDRRKSVVEMDDVINVHREVIYKLRRKILNAAEGDEESKTWFVDRVSKHSDFDESIWLKNEKALGKEVWQQVVMQLSLPVIDTLWMDHLVDMDQIREGIGLRGYAQRDPMVEYKREGHARFEVLVEKIYAMIAERLMRVEVKSDTEALGTRRQPRAKDAVRYQRGDIETGVSEEASVQKVESGKTKVGRNDPCPCGSGKKYKKCCGANA